MNGALLSSLPADGASWVGRLMQTVAAINVGYSLLAPASWQVVNRQKNRG